MKKALLPVLILLLCAVCLCASAAPDSWYTFMLGDTPADLRYITLRDFMNAGFVCEVHAEDGIAYITRPEHEDGMTVGVTDSDPDSLLTYVNMAFADDLPVSWCGGDPWSGPEYWEELLAGELRERTDEDGILWLCADLKTDEHTVIRFETKGDAPKLSILRDGKEDSRKPGTAQPPEQSGTAAQITYPVLARTTVRNVNLRSKPAANGYRRGRISVPGTVITVTGEVKDKKGRVWYRAETDAGAKGYIPGDYILLAPDGSLEEEHKAQLARYPFRAETNTNNVVVRAEPEAKAKKAETLKKAGTVVTVRDKVIDTDNNGWYWVRLGNGRTGYILCEYLDETDS